MSPPRPKAGYRLRRTLGVVRDVTPPTVCLPERVFGDRASLRGWLRGAGNLAHIGRLVDRKLGPRNVVVVGTPAAERLAENRDGVRNRFALDGILAAVGPGNCRQFLKLIGKYDGLKGAALLAPCFGADGRGLIDEHTEGPGKVPVFAIEYTCVRDPATGSFGAAMRLVAGFSALPVRKLPENVREDFWNEVAGHLSGRGIAFSSLVRSATSLSIAVRVKGCYSFRIMALIRSRQLAVGVMVPNISGKSRANSERLARSGRLSIPGLAAPERVCQRGYDAYYFALTGVLASGSRPEAEPEYVAELLVRLKGQVEKAMSTV